MQRTTAYTIATAIGVALAIVFHAWATTQRGYEAIGGEFLLITLPMWLWMYEMIFLEG